MLSRHLHCNITINPLLYRSINAVFAIVVVMAALTALMVVALVRQMVAPLVVGDRNIGYLTREVNIGYALSD
jgi:hypothetical protein